MLESPASYTISIRSSEEKEYDLAELSYIGNDVYPKRRWYQRFSLRRISWIQIILGISAVLFIFTYLTKPTEPVEALSKSPSSFPTPSWDPVTPKTGSWKFWKSTDEIPNIAHFVRQINRDRNYTPVAPFKVEFRHLVSYYSCYHYLKPEKIYFWTDTPQEMLDDARLNGDKYTKALFKIPNLEIRPVTFPNVTAKGIAITEYAHRSDFVRTRVMAKMGGQYFDDDAWVLRDLKPLRQAGFDNVFSLDWGSRIAQATWLSKPMNPLMMAFAELQEVFFNGDWLRASNDLVTALMVHFSRAPGQKSSLTLEKDAFFQGTWEGDGLKRYYEVHEYDPYFKEPEYVEGDVLETFTYDMDWGWRMDWRRSWVVHGFSNEVRLKKAEWLFGEYGGFTEEYVLSRRSNMGRALYPAVKAMIDDGLVE